MNDKERFVDELLNSALARRQGAEPRAGLESRILERVHTAGERSARRALWISCAATAAAVVMLAVIYMSRRPQGASAIVASHAAIPVLAPPPERSMAANSEPVSKSGTSEIAVQPRRTARREARPRQRIATHRWPSQFPTPAPLSPEEKALVRYVQETPPQVLAASLFEKQFLDQPVEIKPLKIAPLEIQPLSVGAAKENLQ
jgi:hypothetical protein